MYTYFHFQQLYQTLTDYDIRFYIYELLKVSFDVLARKNSDYLSIIEMYAFFSYYSSLPDLYWLLACLPLQMVIWLYRN